MKKYPLPRKYHFSKKQNTGRFLEKRKDRIHCGIDLYAPKNTPVFAVENGIICHVSKFTTPLINPYWNTTYEIILQSDTNYFFRYAELDNVLVKEDEIVSAGDQIGIVGQVLNPKKINQNHPEYIQQLAKQKKISMLHFEMYSDYPEKSDKYLGGNWFAENKPKGLCNPTEYLHEL